MEISDRHFREVREETGKTQLPCNVPQSSQTRYRLVRIVINQSGLPGRKP